MSPGNHELHLQKTFVWQGFKAKQDFLSCWERFILMSSTWSSSFCRLREVGAVSLANSDKSEVVCYKKVMVVCTWSLGVSSLRVYTSWHQQLAPEKMLSQTRKNPGPTLTCLRKFRVWWYVCMLCYSPRMVGGSSQSSGQTLQVLKFYKDLFRNPSHVIQWNLPRQWKQWWMDWWCMFTNLRILLKNQ